jgi:hypothetical protein
MWRTSVETIADIDVEIVSARWRWLHGGWEENVDAVNRAKAAIDLLLERRYNLMQAAAAGPSEAAAASGAGEARCSPDLSRRRHSATDGQCGSCGELRQCLRSVG